jgi:uncharacterized protein (TIGR00661 family)
MKYVFVVQGEGRGHLTQAIALHSLLTEAGHEVTAVLVGKSPSRTIPKFFYDKISSPIIAFDSPNFVMDKSQRGIKLSATIWSNLIYFRKFLKSLTVIKKAYKTYQPDVIINFYDFLGGFYNILYRLPAKLVCVGHQYLLEHPKFEYPKTTWLDKFLLQQNTNITSVKATKKLALSFQKYLPDFGKTVLVPPLLRQEVLPLKPERGDFILIYLNNAGYAQEVLDWHAQNPDTKIECFWDRKDAPEMEQIRPNLIIHQISDVKFLEKMRTCKAFAATAGFESVCEAMYLGKPAMMVPIQNHLEQACNALDAQKAGAGVPNTSFNLSKLINYLETHTTDPEKMAKWVLQAPDIFIKELTNF